MTPEQIRLAIAWTPLAVAGALAILCDIMRILELRRDMPSKEMELARKPARTLVPH